MIRQYDTLGETVYEQCLSNGLPVRVVLKPGFVKKLMYLAVDYGSMDMAFFKNGVSCTTPQGVAHYLEHKMFDMPDCNVMQLFSKYGGNPNAFTSYDITAYYVECTEHFAENLELLLSYVSTPYFTEESVEKERGIIGQEIRMYEDSADSRVYENLFSAMYKEHPVRHNIAGTVESISRITAKTLYDCYESFYTPENMMLCVVGDVDPEQVFRMAERIIPKGQETNVIARNYGAPEIMKAVQAKKTCHMEVSMPMFGIGFKTEPTDRGKDAMLQEFIGELAAEILMGESSGLYARLYEKNLIDPDFSCEYEAIKGMSLISAAGDSREPETVCKAILEEARRIEKDGIDEKLFEQLKRSIQGHRVRDLDSFDSICYKMCAYYFEGTDYYDFPSVFPMVTPSLVAQFLKRTVTEERMALSVVLPKQ